MQLPKMTEADVKRELKSTQAILVKELENVKDPKHGKQSRQKIRKRIRDTVERLALLQPVVPF